MNQLESLTKIGDRLEQSIKEHNTLWDGFWYTAATVIPLVLSTYSSIAANYPKYSVWVSIASATAALFIALERALGFGARWRYHREMKGGYRNLQDGISYVEVLPDDRKQSFLNDWWARLVALRAREGHLPNSGGDETK